MNSELERYVMNIVNQTECSQEEKTDLYEELMTHLEQSKAELMMDGMGSTEAVQEAIKRFGSEKEISSQLQQVRFPFRRELILIISLLSFACTISAYLLQLFIEGDAYIGWLTLSLGLSSLLFFMALNPLPNLQRKRWMNTIFIAHIITYVYGYAIVSSLDHPMSLPLVILTWLIVLIALYLIYQTTINDPYLSNHNRKIVKGLHQLNITLGIAIGGVTLFLLWIGLFLFGGFSFKMIILTIPFFLWILFYIGQIKAVRRSRKLAYFIGFVSCLMVIALLLFLLWPTFL